MSGIISGPKPAWLTFDCYGTLIQWDEGLLRAVSTLLAGRRTEVTAERLIATYDRYEHALEQAEPASRFRELAGRALALAMHELGIESDARDVERLTEGISAMPPFAEVAPALRRVHELGYRVCIVSNTDDDVIAGNVAQLEGHIDRVITAQQAGAYKPSAAIFEYAWSQLGVDRAQVLHVCASPHLDLQAARDLGFRAVWVDRGTGRTPLSDYASDAVLPDLARLPELLERSW